MGKFLKAIWYFSLVVGILFYFIAMFKGGTVTRRFCSIFDKELCYKIADYQDDIHSRVLDIVKKRKGAPKELDAD